MKVSELIEQLKEMPQDAEVYIDNGVGCGVELKKVYDYDEDSVIIG